MLSARLNETHQKTGTVFFPKMNGDAGSERSLSIPGLRCLTQQQSALPPEIPWRHGIRIAPQTLSSQLRQQFRAAICRLRFG